jgi:YopX protein
MKTLIFGLILGCLIGSLVSLYAETERYSTAYDKNGKAIHVGDIIAGSNGEVIKVHGFTVTYRPGTFAAYGYQVSVCPKCLWVETAPGSFSLKDSNRDSNLHSRFTQLLNWLTISVSADSGSDCIVWGS